jgi:hypothetical protein
MSYRFITDPGHGWLEVPMAELVELEIAHTISKCSYMSRDGKLAYLEEDCDAPRFNDAKGGPQALEITHQESTFVRRLPHYECPDYVDPDPPKPYRSGGETFAGKDDDLDPAELVEGLEASGLKVHVIDEDTDFSKLPSLGEMLGRKE